MKRFLFQIQRIAESHLSSLPEQLVDPPISSNHPMNLMRYWEGVRDAAKLTLKHLTSLSHGGFNLSNFLSLLAEWRVNLLKKISLNIFPEHPLEELYSQGTLLPNHFAHFQPDIADSHQKIIF